MDTATAEKRMETFRALAAEYDIDPERADNSASEDVAAVLDGEEPLERFCAVTRAGDFTYLRPYYAEREMAERSATENIDNDIYAEHPVAVIDLDTDERWEPSWGTLVWRNTLAMSVPAKRTELLKLAESVSAGNTDPDVLAEAAERVLLGGPCYERERD